MKVQAITLPIAIINILGADAISLKQTNDDGLDVASENSAQHRGLFRAVHVSIVLHDCLASRRPKSCKYLPVNGCHKPGKCRVGCRLRHRTQRTKPRAAKPRHSEDFQTICCQNSSDSSQTPGKRLILLKLCRITERMGNGPSRSSLTAAIAI